MKKTVWLITLILMISIAYAVTDAGGTLDTTNAGDKELYCNHIKIKVAQISNINVTTDGSDTSTKATIFYENGTNKGKAVSTATITGNKAQFTGVYLNNTDMYSICTHADGINRDERRSSSASFPYDRTNVYYNRSGACLWADYSGDNDCDNLFTYATTENRGGITSIQSQEVAIITNFTVTARDYNTNAVINIFNISIEGNRNYTTTNGIIYSNLTNTSLLHNITVYSENYTTWTWMDWNITDNLLARLNSTVSYINLSVRYYNGTSAVFNASIQSIYDFQNITNADGYHIFTVDKFFNYTIKINDTKFEFKNVTIFTNNTQDNVSLMLYTRNSINFSFYDTNNKSLAGTNVNLYLGSDVYTINYSGSLGYIYADLLTPSFYNIVTTATGYADNYLYYTITDGSYNKINIYMSNASESQIIATVYDNINNKVEGAYINVQKYDLATGNYLDLGLFETNFEGEALIYMTKNTVKYRFYIYYPFGTLVESYSPTYIYSDTINFIINIFGGFADEYYTFEDIDYLFSYNNYTRSLLFYYNDPNALTSQGCINLWHDGILFNSSCYNGATSTLSLGVPNISGYSYLASADIIYSGNQERLDSLSISFPKENGIGMIGLLLAMLMVLAIVFLTANNVPLMIVAAPIPLIILSALKIIRLDIYATLGIEIVMIILAYIVRYNT